MTKRVVFNKGNIRIVKTSTPQVCKAYYVQVKGDFSMFLMSQCHMVRSVKRIGLD